MGRYLGTDTAGFFAGALLFGWQLPWLKTMIFRPMVAMVISLPEHCAVSALFHVIRLVGPKVEASHLIRVVVLVIQQQFTSTTGLFPCAKI